MSYAEQSEVVPNLLAELAATKKTLSEYTTRISELEYSIKASDAAAEDARQKNVRCLELRDSARAQAENFLQEKERALKTIEGFQNELEEHEQTIESLREKLDTAYQAFHLAKGDIAKFKSHYENSLEAFDRLNAEKHQMENRYLKIMEELKAELAEKNVRNLQLEKLVEGMNYWKEYRRATGGAAVVWVTGDDGSLVIITRGEYREQLMKNIEPIMQPQYFEVEGPGVK